MRIVSFLLFFIIGIFAQAQNTPIILSTESEISILTIGQGPELYDSFGHTAVRVRDPRKGIDIVFNYGLFDFNTPNFYTKFAQGKLLYRLGISQFDDFLSNYIAQQRFISSQKLIQTQVKKQDLFDFLYNNAKGENSRYLYDFLYDNCATRPANAINSIYPHDIFKDFKPTEEGLTHRQLIQKNVPWNTWGSLGMDVAIGSVTDRPISIKEYLFLPEYAQDALNVSKGSNGPLVQTVQTIYKPEKPNTYKESLLFSPLIIFSLIAIAIIYCTYTDNKNNKGVRILDNVLLAITGIIGILLTLLWFATDHSTTKWNYNLLWAFPFHLIAALSIRKVKTKKWIYPYLKLTLILLVLLTFHWVVGVQKYPFALLPLLIALGIRFTYLLSQIKKQHS